LGGGFAKSTFLDATSTAWNSGDLCSAANADQTTIFCLGANRKIVAPMIDTQAIGRVGVWQIVADKIYKNLD
jgi:hypothetical protein